MHLAVIKPELERDLMDKNKVEEIPHNSDC